MTTTTRTVVRTAFIVLVTAIVIVWASVDFSQLWHPRLAFLSFSADSSGRITTVDPFAARSGLRVGDRIDEHRMSPEQQIRLFYPAANGEPIILPLTSGRSVTLHPQAIGRTTLSNAFLVPSVLAELVFIVIAAALVLLRPSAVSWAFYVFSFSLCFYNQTIPSYLPWQGAAATFLVYSTWPVSGPAFVLFALRFPDAVPARWGRLIETSMVFVIAPSLALLGVVSAVLYLLHGTESTWTNNVALPLVYGSFACGIVILVGRYATAKGTDRTRLRWVVAAFAVAFLPLLAWTFLGYIGVSIPGYFYDLAGIWMVFAPIALAYTILKHRLYDIRLVFSRALLYAIITSFTVGLLALADWLLGRWLAESRFALVAEVALALVLGVMLTTIHRRTERFLNGVIFRAQTIALEALRRFAQETDLIPDPEHLLAQTYDALRKRLDSEYVAIYTAEGSSYTLVTPTTDATPALFGSHDFAVLRLRRWQQPFECDEPEHALRGALLLPMTARGQLVGFIVCGPKHDHTHYLPEEVETLSLLTHRTGSAFALLTMASAGPNILTVTRT